MGRPSKLTPTQWADVDRRRLEGEPRRALAREFGVSEAAIREREGKFAKIETVRAVAAKIVDAQQSLAALPVAAQVSAQNLAEKLRSISGSLASAAELGARTSHRLHALANSQVSKVDDAEPMKSIGELRDVGVLTKLANDSASIALNLLAANKDQIAKANEPPPPEQAPIRPQLDRESWLREHGLG